MDANYGRGEPFTLGIEEEFQLLNAASLELTSRFDEVFGAEAARDERIKAELLQSVVEVAIRPARTVAAALEEAAELRARLRDAAAAEGALIAGAGTHPFSRWEHQEVTDEERYRDLIESMAWVAKREVIFGLHLHVALESPAQAIAVANALRARLPELLALSANSPFWHGRDTGLASARTKIFDTFPRSGLPPAFASFEDFARTVERGVRTRSWDDYTFLWWDLRPHPKLGTIEVRICDAQTRLASVGALAALVQSLVATLAERHERGELGPVEPRLLVDENRWRAARHGLEGDLIWLERDEERPAREAIGALVDEARPAARKLGCEGELAEVEAICARGSGAAEQRRVHDEAGNLLAVARFLADETVGGL